jgi:hypothetical protein
MAARAGLGCGMLVLASALLLTGCGRPYKVVPVSGRVQLDGKPLAGATVQFVPVAESGQELPSSFGTTDRDGRYTLTLIADGNKTSGAVVGKHKVMILLGASGGGEATERSFHKQLPERYHRKTELECEVPSGGREDANFDDLRSK